MAIGVLGPVVVDDGTPLSPRDRVVLAALVVRRGEVVAADQLADALWPGDPPDSWRKVVQSAVVRLRKVLGPALIQTAPGGYRLAAGEDDVDAWRFERLVRRAVELAEFGEHDRASEAFERATALWRGEPFADLDGWAPGAAEASRLLELRRLADERAVEARLALGEHRDVVARATSLVAAEPLREQRWGLLATALYRAGRQGEALRVLHDARRVLGDQLGVEPGAELVDLEQAILQQDAALAAPAVTRSRAGAHQPCPYKGLEAYGERDAETFFGRESEIATCRQRMAGGGFLAVVGASGTGKSSLVRAGMVPALRAQGRAVAVCTPGADPPAALSAALASVAPDAAVVVDQGEELFAVCIDPARRERFAAALTEHAAHRPVVLTLRADHIGAVAAYPDLARLVEAGLHLLGPMSEADLRGAIEGPARAAGLRLEAGLVDLLVRDVIDQPGALPLLSHALVETWARREGHVLTVDGYRESGGVRGAVARTAEQLYDSLPETQRSTARSLFLRLVSVAGDGEAVRHRLSRTMLAGGQDEIVDTLARARLLTVGEESLEIAHEALARAWPRLQGWLEEDREGQRILTHLTAAAEDWVARGRDPAELYRGARLQTAVEWVRRSEFELSPTEQAFIAASTEGEAAEAAALVARAEAQSEANRRLRRLLRAVAVLLVLALGTGALAAVQGRRAADDRDQARRASQAAALQSVVSQSLALRETKRDLGALLALEAYRLDPGARTESALLGTFTGSPGFLGFLRAPVAGFWGAGLTPDGGRLVVSDIEDSTVRVYDVRDMALVRTLAPQLPGAQYGRVAVSPDGTLAAVGSSTGAELTGGSLSVYDLGTGAAQFTPVQLDYPVGSVAISPDGALVAVSGGEVGSTQVHDLRTGALVSRIAPAPGGDGPNRVHTVGLAFAASDRLVVGSEVGLIRTVDPRSAATVASLDGPAGLSEQVIHLAPDGRRMVSAGAEGAALRDLTTGQTVWRTPPGTLCNRLAVAFRPGLVLCADPFGRVRGLDLDTGVVVESGYDFQQGAVSELAVSADGRTLGLIGASVGVAGVWRLDGSGPITHTLGTGADSVVGYPATGGRSLLLGTGGSAEMLPDLRIVDPAQGGRTVDELGEVARATWSPEGPDELGAVFTDGTAGGYDVRRHRRKGGRLVLDINPASALEDVVHRRLILFDEQGHVRSYRSGRPVPPRLDLPGGRGPSSAGITPDGRLLLVAYEDSGTETIDLATGRRVAGPNPAMTEVAVSSRGLAAASGPDGGVAFYDPGTLRPRGAALPGALGGVYNFRFSADGNRLLIQSGDRTLRLVDVPTRTIIGDPIPIGETVDLFLNERQLLRADGKEIAAELDDNVAIWNLEPADWIGAACKVAGRNLTREEWMRYLGAFGAYHRTCPA